jgi:predicted ATPase
MKLNSILIRAFKSIAEVRVDLQPDITVLVGPNAAGKSNFVDALRFMRDTAKSGLEDAISRRDGMGRIRPEGSDEETVVYMDVDLTSDDAASADDDLYLYSLAVTDYSDGYALAFPEDDLRRKVETDVASWKFSALNTETLRTPSADDSDRPLRDDASNWAAVIHTAKGNAKGRQMLERITEMMQVVLPDFQSMSVIKAGSYFVPQFKFGATKRDTQTFDPVALSDGTLRIFGILLALYQNPPPSLIVVEEPELCVHPGVLGMLAEAFKEVSEVTQIIVTTHSPELIDHFGPENIRIVTKTGGATRISPLKRTQQEAVQEGLMGLGEFMAAEGLQPELL